MHNTRLVKQQYIIAAIAIVLEIITLITEFFDGRYSDCIVDLTLILPPILMIAAFKRPSMPFAVAAVAVGSLFANFTVFVRVAELAMRVLSPSVISSESADGIMIGVYCIGLIYSCVVVFRCAGQIWDMQKENFDNQYKSAAASRDVDEMTRFMVKYLRPDNTGPILILASALYGAGSFIIQALGDRRRGMNNALLFIELVVVVVVFAGIIIWHRRSYQSYIRQLSDSEEISRMAREFSQGTRYWTDGIILGEHYIFVKNSEMVFKYSDIAKIYQDWSDLNTMRHSPWWHLRIVTVDGKDQFLASIPFFRTEENFVEYVLPVILEIRSRNPQVVIGK